MLTATIIQHINMYSLHQVMIPIRLKNVKMRSQFWELAQSNLSKEKRLVPKKNNKNKKKTLTNSDTARGIDFRRG